MASSTPNPLAFLGVGWAFPVAVGPDGAIVEASYQDDVEQAILIILQTNPGERVMRPTFGAGLNDFVFEPINTNTMEAIKDRIQSALTAWEPRIDVEDVTITRGDAPDPQAQGPAGGSLPDYQLNNCLMINITYLIRTTNTRLNLVYPFYLQEGTSQ